MMKMITVQKFNTDTRVHETVGEIPVGSGPAAIKDFAKSFGPGWYRYRLPGRYTGNTVNLGNL